MSTDEFKERLEAEKLKLESELKDIGRRNPSNPNDWEPIPPKGADTESDPVDIADHTITFDTNASIVADLENQYNDVLAALLRIEKGTYGICEVGGEPIEEKRLGADPSARTCLKHLKR